MRIEFPHRLPAPEAKARVQALGDYLNAKHGIAVRWTGDEARIEGRYMIVSIEGVVRMQDGLVVFDGKDPGLLWRKKAKDYLSHKLSRYLDPGTPVEKLPRGPA